MGDEFQPHRHETTRCSFCQKFYNFPKVLQSSQEQGNSMKISIERGALLRTLGNVQTVVERRDTIPILANDMLVAENDSLKIIASDMEIEGEEIIPTTVIEPVKTNVSASKFYRSEEQPSE